VGLRGTQRGARQLNAKVAPSSSPAPWTDVQSSARVALPRFSAMRTPPRIASSLPWGFVALRRFQSRAATNIGPSTTRLSSALGVSHPLDALLRPKPSRPCFMPVTPLSFDLQRVSPPLDRSASRRPNPSCRFPAARSVDRNRPRALQPRLQGSKPSGDPCRTAIPVSRFAGADPLLAFAPSGISPFGTRSRASTESPLMGFGSPPIRRPQPKPKPSHRRSTCSSESQRTEGRLASFESCRPS
jgi:hypothetical protein